MDEAAKVAQRDRIFGFMMGYQALWILDVGLKSGVIAALAEAPEGVGEEALAAQLGQDPDYLRTWLRAAYAYELLDFEPDRGYRLPDGLAPVLLDPADPLYVGGRIQFFAALHEDFRAFPDRLKDGRPFWRADHDPALLRGIMETSKPDFPIMTERVIPQEPALERRLAAGGEILDLGCGAGFGLVHLARRYPKARLLGIDPEPQQLELARAQVDQAGLEPRVRLEQGDARHLDQPARFDLVVMNIALHETGGEADYRDVLARVRRALRPGGWLLVSELPYPGTVEEYRSQPAYKLMAGVQFHEILTRCGMITIPHLEELLREAGFAPVRKVDQPSPTRVMFLAGMGA
jgi:ubiquinone/menaquinone biosynthesis C-methylase UbiE